MKKMLCTYFLLVVSIFFQTAMAQTPDWADASYRKQSYSENEFIVGFASEPNTQKEITAELLKRLEGYVKTQLVEYIRVTIKSETSQQVSETDGGITQSYKSMYSSASNLNLTGVKVETAYDQRKNIGYALAYANRSELLGYYLDIVNSNIQQVELKIKSAQEAINSSSSEQAFRLTLEAVNMIPDIEQAQGVIIALKRGNAKESETQLVRLATAKSESETILRNIQRSGGNSLDDICYFITKGLHNQVVTLDGPVALSPFTYQDTRVGSELSNRINQTLASKLVTTAGFKIISGSQSSGYLLTGTYWKESNELKLIATLKKPDGSMVATAEAFLPLAWVEGSRIKYLPENFEEAFSRMRVFAKDEVVKGDLNLEIWTNKGDDNLVFLRGEKLKFYVRANKECYIRMVYHMADNQSILLMDNYYIAAHMANRVVELPDEFECDEPFGVETLQVNAQSEPFPPLKTQLLYGYNLIVESIDDIVVNTRGLKRVTTKELDKAEKRLIFTTMRK